MAGYYSILGKREIIPVTHMDEQTLLKQAQVFHVFISGFLLSIIIKDGNGWFTKKKDGNAYLLSVYPWISDPRGADMDTGLQPQVWG
jgi:hypothetical protein